jgi:hypothetical protein
MRVSASIMAHPDRSDLVTDLVERLDRPVPIYWDPEGPPSGNKDRVWRVAREAWSMHDPDAGYHVLIQDDAVPCADFLAGMELALDHVPGDVLVCPYLGRGRNVPLRWARMAEEADTTGASWVRSHTLMWGVSIAVPTAMVPGMIEWCDRKAGMPDDMRVGRYFQSLRIDTWYTWPSLVDHRPVDSLTKHRQVERVARRHHQGSALDPDWTGPTVLDPMNGRRVRGHRSSPRGTWRARGREGARRRTVRVP